ncbi:MAG: hypothetical protein GXY36_19925 [Chloroflexi bacterium]|nr:hypothetical protein [Chloroflexota bacterium]
MYSRQRLARTIGCVLAVLLLAALSACGEEPTATPPTPLTPVAMGTLAPTQPPVVTRIVAPPPTFTPTPAPTLAYEVEAVAGRWILFLDLQLRNTDYVDELNYYGAAELIVDLNGTVSGQGIFEPAPFDQECDAQVLDGSPPLNFTLTGTTFEQDGQIWADFTLVPEQPRLVENYALVCPDFEDIRPSDRPILWPTLASLNLTRWQLALESGQMIPLEPRPAGDLLLGGEFLGELRFERG